VSIPARHLHTYFYLSSISNTLSIITLSSRLCTQAPAVSQPNLTPPPKATIVAAGTRLGCPSTAGFSDMNTGGKAPACVPTWRGHVETTKDALLVFEACFNGTLSHCFRRPHDRERNQLIVSGNVFVYEEATSGIKRWTDGIPWSPSRILTNFLIYRQLNSPFPPGEKKRATKRSHRVLKPGEPYQTGPNPTSMNDETKSFSPGSPETPGLKKEDTPEKDSNRGLVGSLVDSYEFKENGLLKKTMTVTVNNVQHHLVSYYSLDDAKYKLKTPREDPALKDLRIRDQLINQPKFKFPNLDDAGDGSYDQMDGTPNAYPAYYANNYDQARMYSTPPHPHQVPTSLAYHAGAYAPSHPPSGSSNYPTPVTSAYTPMTPSVQYPQHSGHHHQYYQQHPGSQSVQHYQRSSQHYQGHHSQVSGQHIPPLPKNAVSQNTLPRPGAYDYLGQSSNSGAHNDPYGSNGSSAAPHSQSQPAHGWQVGYPSSSHWGTRPEETQYPAYRAQS